MGASTSASVVILGAGPAGVAAARQLARRRFRVTVVEASSRIGGNSGSFGLGGLNVDFGSHQLHPMCAPQILSDIKSMLGSELIERQRHGRIRLWNCWIHFPLKPLELAARAPFSFWLAAGRDAVRRQGPKPEWVSFGGILEHRFRFGRRICRDFYFPYARKIWGMDPNALDGEQARRRVTARSAMEIVKNSFPGIRDHSNTFYYPRDGYGRICEAYYAAAAADGARFKFDTKVCSIEPGGGFAVIVRAHGPKGRLMFSADVPCAEVPITRCSEPKNYGLVGVYGRTVLCLELPCSTTDPVWNATEAELAAIGLRALGRADLPVKCKVLQVVIHRIPAAYPIYTPEFREHLTNALACLEPNSRIITLGRQGLFSNTNTHHILEQACAASESICDDGTINRAQWARSRMSFDQQVVQD